MWINYKTRKFSGLFYSHKIHLLILLSIFTDRFDRFPFPFRYSRTSEIPHPLIYLRPEKGTEYSSVKMTMTDISSYYHNLKLGPVGMLEVGGGEGGETLWWNCIQLGSWISVTCGPEGQSASLPLYLIPKYATSVKLCNQAVRLWKSLHWPQLKVKRGREEGEVREIFKSLEYETL